MDGQKIWDCCLGEAFLESWLSLSDPRPKIKYSKQGLSQELETGCPKLATVKSLGILLLIGDHIGVKNI